MPTPSESTPYTLGHFVDDFRTIAVNNSDTHDVFKRLAPLAESLAASADLKAHVRKDCDPVQGFGFQVLHEEPDHTLAVAVLSWLPGRGTPPHDHGTWGLVVGVEGDEVNEFWKRVDDGSQPGYADLQKLSEKVFAPGQPCCSLRPSSTACATIQTRSACRSTSTASTSTSPTAHGLTRS